MRTLLLLLALASCGKKSAPEDTKVASCNSDSMKMCVEYSSANLAAGSDSLAKLCTVVDSGAKFTMTACPTPSAGKCKRNEGTDVYYDGNPLGDVAALEKMCTDKGGTWSK
ncbi:MAG: hypothetical protein HOV81_10085 [Kofleriaceae bacterium]|nr:hypothetical protein [Kofleriaceae bacterium]